MNLENIFSGQVYAQITGADIPGSLKRLSDQGILLNSIEYLTDLSVLVGFDKRDFKKVRELLRKKGDTLVIKKEIGLPQWLLDFRKRPVLIFTFLLLLMLTFFVPSRILFVRVEGNITVPDELILDVACENGLTFGAIRKNIRNEPLKNSLLKEIPQLDWAGITTCGCVATVTVRETEPYAVEHSGDGAVSSIVAAADGVIESVTVTSGQALCRPGQVVQKGQILISGYEDRGLLIHATQAQGEVYAKTFHPYHSVSLRNTAQRTVKTEVRTRFSIQIGKKLIKLFKDSGISPAGCVKIYEKKYLSLPGGFHLPIALLSEQIISYDLKAHKMEKASADWQEKAADSYILGKMSAGQILQKKADLQELEDIFLYTGYYSCREQIGYHKTEETLNDYGKTS